LLSEHLFAFVERAFPLAEYVSQLGQFPFGFGLLLDRFFLDFQFGRLELVGGILVGLRKDPLRFAFRVLATQTGERTDDRESRSGSDHSRDNSSNDFGHGPLLQLLIRSVRGQDETGDRKSLRVQPGTGNLGKGLDEHDHLGLCSSVCSGTGATRGHRRWAKSIPTNHLSLTAEKLSGFAEVQSPQAANPNPTSNSNGHAVFAGNDTDDPKRDGLG